MPYVSGRCLNLPGRHKAPLNQSERLCHRAARAHLGLFPPPPPPPCLSPPPVPQEKFTKNATESVKQQMPTLNSSSI